MTNKPGVTHVRVSCPNFACLEIWHFLRDFFVAHAQYAVRFAWDSSFFMCTKMVCLRLGRCHWIPSIIALSDPRNLCQHPHVHGHWKSQVVEKTSFYKSPCFWYHFKMDSDWKMRFSPKRRKLKIDIVSSKFEQNRWRGSQEIAKKQSSRGENIGCLWTGNLALVKIIMLPL